MKKYTQAEIRRSLQSLDLQENDTVLIRADVRYLGMFSEGMHALPAVLFEELAQCIDLSQGTIVVPTGSLSLCNTDIPFDIHQTKSELGVFSEYIRNLPSSIRSCHPFFSYTAIGKHAEYVCATHTKHAFGLNSPKDKMICMGAKAISIGAPPNRTCTTVHHAEFMAGVPYRYVKEFNHPIQRRATICREKFYLYVTYRDMDIVRNKNKKLWENYTGVLNQASLGAASIYAYNMQEFYTHCIEQMQSDMYIWLDKEPQIKPFIY